MTTLQELLTATEQPAQSMTQGQMINDTVDALTMENDFTNEMYDALKLDRTVQIMSFDEMTVEEYSKHVDKVDAILDYNDMTMETFSDLTIEEAKEEKNKEGFKEKVKNASKKVVAFIKKMIMKLKTFIKKWVAKAMTLFSGNEEDRLKTAALVVATKKSGVTGGNDNLSKVNLTKLKSFIKGMTLGEKISNLSAGDASASSIGSGKMIVITKKVDRNEHTYKITVEDIATKIKKSEDIKFSDIDLDVLASTCGLTAKTVRSQIDDISKRVTESIDKLDKTVDGSELDDKSRSLAVASINALQKLLTATAITARHAFTVAKAVVSDGTDDAMLLLPHIDKKDVDIDVEIDVEIEEKDDKDKSSQRGATTPQDLYKSMTLKNGNTDVASSGSSAAANVLLEAPIEEINKAVAVLVMDESKEEKTKRAGKELAK